MEVVLPELVACELYEHGVIEPDVTSWVIELVTPGTVFFDIGAHLGYHSLLAAALGGDVHAFEPTPSTCQMLKRNVTAGVTVVEVGMWSDDTVLELQDFGSKHSAVNTFETVKDETISAPTTSYRIPVTTIDTYVRASGATPDVIKIDAEGAERAVLAGGVETIRRARPVICIEVGDTAVARSSRAAIDFACHLGYVPYELADGAMRVHETRDRYSYGNLLLVPRDCDRPGLNALLRGG